MKRGLDSLGFTIIETMIVLAVSAAILVSALGVVSGSQNKNLFKQAMNDVNEQMTTVINNVANGYYPRNQNLSCTESIGGTSLNIATGTGDRGTVKNCIFLGRVVQFLDNEDFFRIYSVAGLRQTGTVVKKEVEGMAEAKATTVPSPDVIPLKNGLTVEAARVVGGGNIGAIGFFTSFGRTASGQLQSGALATDFGPIPGSNLTIDSVVSQVIDSSAASFRSRYDTGATKNPPTGVQVCFRSGTTADEFGIIQIGGGNRVAANEMTIRFGSCW